MSIIKRVGTLLIVSLVAVTSVSVAAQRRDRRDRGEMRWGSDQTPQAGVCLFENSNFQGRYFCLAPGDELRTLPRDMRDKISSLRIIGNVDVVVFRNERFRGASGRFLTDVRDLRRQGWNDQISSLRVTNTAAAWDGERFPAWGRARLPREGACFYQDANFKGDYFCIPRGGSYASVPAGFNDRISSIRVLRAGRVLIFGDRDFEGRAAPLTASVANLRRGVWNDRISSIRVF